MEDIFTYINSKTHKKSVLINAHIDTRMYRRKMVDDWVKKYGMDETTEKNGPIPQPYPGHKGIDLRGKDDNEIYTVVAGAVTYAGNMGNSWGNFVEIVNGSYTFYYMHLSNLNVLAGQYVAEGDVLGWEGGTGGWPPHLHFEVRENGVPIDPYNIAQHGLEG